MSAALTAELRAGRVLPLALLVLILSACATAPPPAPDPMPESPAGAKPMTVRGQLTTEGVECPALRGEDGALYTLLGDLGGFKPGDRVVVEGTPVEISFCMQGTTLQVTRIARQS
jgi:hypothetical protein